MKTIFFWALGVFCLNEVSAQNSYVNGDLNSCNVWQGTSLFYLNNLMINGNTVTSTETDRSVNSITFNYASSVLNFNGNSSVSFGGASTLSCPPAPGTIIYSIPYQPGGNPCYYGYIQAVNPTNTWDGRLLNWHAFNTWAPVTMSAYYKVSTTVKIFNVDGYCCVLRDYTLMWIMKARRAGAIITFPGVDYTDWIHNDGYANNCYGQTVEVSLNGRMNDIVYLQSGDEVFIDVAAYISRTGIDPTWMAGHLFVQIESTYQFFSY